MKYTKNKLLTLTLALVSILMTVVVVNAIPLYGEMALNFQALGPTHPDLIIDPVWSGTISGDIEGKMFYYNTGRKDVSQAHFFEETWLITDEDVNTLLTGTDSGVVSWANDKYRMNGVVTEAYGDYAHLVGHNVHMSGSITWQNIGTPEEPVMQPATAPGMFRVN